MKPVLHAAVFCFVTTAVPLMAHDADDPIGKAVSQLPIFDAHIHFHQPAWDLYPVESIIEIMDANGVAMGLVSSTPDEGTIMLWDYAPGRIVPELRPYHGNVESSNWTRSAGITDYLARRLESYPHEGIGEFHIHRLDTTDEALFRDIIAMAKERDIHLHVHSGAEPIRWLYSLDRDVKIIWAHAGLGEPAGAVYDLMAEFPALVADTSLREWEILRGEGGLAPDWERIIYAFQDRLLVGSDTWVNERWDGYGDIIAANRRWLLHLPREVAEKIAYGNAARLFGREISMDLIGTR